MIMEAKFRVLGMINSERGEKRKDISIFLAYPRKTFYFAFDQYRCLPVMGLSHLWKYKITTLPSLISIFFGKILFYLKMKPKPHLLISQEDSSKAISKRGKNPS